MAYIILGIKTGSRWISFLPCMMVLLYQEDLSVGFCCHNALGFVRTGSLNPEPVFGCTVHANPRALWQPDHTDRSSRYYIYMIYVLVLLHGYYNSSLKRRIWCSKREPFHMLLPLFRRVVPLVALLRPQRVIRCLGSLRSGCLNAVNAILPQFNVLTINLRQNPHMETCHINLGNLRGKWYSLREKYCINRMCRVKGE